MRIYMIKLVLASLWFAMTGAEVLRAQTPGYDQLIASELTQDPVFMAWQGNASVQLCGVCHFSPGNDFVKRDTSFCRLTELQQWLKSDKHAVARHRVEPIAKQPAQANDSIQSSDTRLQGGQEWIGESNFLSFAICRKLGYDIQTEAGYAKFRENCMTCHGGYEAAKGTNGFTQQSTNQPGISCNYCHQIGSNVAWIDEHSGVDAKLKWRTLPPTAKSVKGMRDLVSTSSQAALCYGCHIGDLQRQMFVTHQMYAAGHPQLPSVELETLLDAMPRHWRSHDELYESLADDPQRSAYFIENLPAVAAKPDVLSRIDQLPWRTDAMVVGALASQQQFLRMVAQAAEPTSIHWGDYALYDCAACHHELRLPSARQAVRAHGAPGRPRLLDWPQALTRAAGLASDDGQSLPQLNLHLMQAINQRPFGVRVDVGQAAVNLSEALEQLKLQQSTNRLSDSFARKMLKELAQTPDELLIDYHAARQVNWAARGINAELEKLGKPLPQDIRAAIAALGVGPAPARTMVSVELPGGINQAIYPVFVQAELERQANYDMAQFSRELRELSALLISNP